MGSGPASRQMAAAILMDHVGAEDLVGGQIHERFVDEVLRAIAPRRLLAADRGPRSTTGSPVQAHRLAKARERLAIV